MLAIHHLRSDHIELAEVSARAGEDQAKRYRFRRAHLHGNRSLQHRRIEPTSPDQPVPTRSRSDQTGGWTDPRSTSGQSSLTWSRREAWPLITSEIRYSTAQRPNS